MTVKRFTQWGLLCSGAFFLSACATLDVAEKDIPPADHVEKFSKLNEGGRLPKAWQIWRVTPQKNKTQYSLKQYQGRVVLHASADVAASGLVLPLKPRSADQLMLEAMSAAKTISEMSLPIVMMVKESINASYESSLSEGIHFERRLFHSAFATEDQKEGMAAFLEKRPAQFKNR